MSAQDNIRNSDQSLQVRCIATLRTARLYFESSERLNHNMDKLEELSWAVERLEHVLFSADIGKSALLLECYIDLVFVLKKMENQFFVDDSFKQPIGLQVATVNNLLPIHLEWNSHDPNSLFIIEYANYENANKPEWRVYSKTRSTSYTVRGLQQGKAYWFRISALAPATSEL